MGRVFYGFNDKYMLTATVRRDGSSVLGPGHQYFTYPAFAFGWNIDRENFMKPLSWVSSLKFRAGYGVTANQNISPYQILGNLSAVAYNFGTSLQNGYLVTSVPNPNLKFEHTNNINLGIDFGVLDNRVTGTVDVYTQKTYDILQVQSLPLSNGARTTTVNAGNSKGKGLEISVSSHNLVGKFKWNTDFNISFQRSSITELHDGLQQDIGNGWFVGQPFNVIYDYKKIGIWQTNEETEAAKYGEKPGWIKVQDVNTDGKIDANDRQILGSYQPDYIAGLTNHFSYKGFELTAVAFARMGQKVCVNYLADMEGFFNIGRVNQYNLNYWTPTNPTNDFARPDANQSPLYSSTLQYQDGSFVKMRSISLAYNFAESILKNGPVKSLKVSVVVNNPFTIYAPLVKKGLSIDPESNRYGGQSGGASGFSGDALGRALTIGLNIPQTRVWSIGIHASF
jgi:TonB-linked SusC/RagA family outer membrane protein